MSKLELSSGMGAKFGMGRLWQLRMGPHFEFPTQNL